MRTRNTRQKAAIREAFERAQHPLSIDEVLNEARSLAVGLGSATVYRAINMLCAQGWLKKIEVPGEGPRYERAEKDHHHHFQCERCDRLFDLAGCVANVKALLPATFSLRDHALVLYGLCDRCAISAEAY